MNLKIYDEEINGLIENFENEDKNLIKKSYNLAKKAHKNQRRLSGEPYIIHCIEVAKILKDLKMDATTISAGLLHDVLEDTDLTIKDIEKEVGEKIAFLVEGVTHVTTKIFENRMEVFGESLKKMFVAMAKDIRVVIIKLADRLHNMRTVQFLPDEKQRLVAKETLNIYAPLSHRLGIAKIKWELEDISFRILNPVAYQEIKRKIAEKREKREQTIEEIKQRIEEELLKLNIKAEIKGRPKHFYSIYQKMQRENKSFEEIYDLIGIRIITDTISNCYSILGIIHNIWKPVPGRFKDYIAVPKSNMYQSLHTTVFDDKGRTVEIQIRTTEMDKIAEEGIAVHWSYKENRGYDEKEDRQFVWLKQILEWQSNVKNDDFFKELKLNLFDEEVFVFTPKGEVKEFIRGATVLDFAYSIHSELGNKCIGAEVNGKWVSIKYELKNGDIVKVLTSSTQHPTIDWLKFVKTTKAKNRIRHWLKTNSNRKENIERGKMLLKNVLLKNNINITDIDEKILTFYNLKTLDDLFAAIGYGELSDTKVAGDIKKFLKKKEKVEKRDISTSKLKKNFNDIIIEEKYSDIIYRFAKCCNPVPGDDIIGIFTKKGISIHKKNCINLEINKIHAPLIKVKWSGDNTEGFYNIKLKILIKNKVGAINKILDTLTKNNILINSIQTKNFSDVLKSDLLISVKNTSHLKDILNSLNRLAEVINVERIN